MDKGMFAELVESIEKMGGWLRDEGVHPPRVTFAGEPDPRQVRAELGSGTPPRERKPVRSLYPLPRSLWERVRA